MKNIGLYIHIPFCSGKCPYCDFYSVGGSESEFDRYTQYLIEKILSYKGKYHADTVYIGGGTPSLLGTDRLCKILSAVNTSFGTASEVTAEVNPRSAMSLDFRALSAVGLDRVSMGLQSANDAELKLLGRRHTAHDASAAVDKLRREGIDNISLDLMLGISGQTKQTLINSIGFCENAGAAHISAYMLKVEDGTPYARMRENLALPDDDAVCDLYETAVFELARRGYAQYEISNFAKPRRESRHNLKYWRCEEYLGLGAAAHSFIGGRRFYYDRSFDEFYRDITHSDGEGGGKEEYIALALRLAEGVRFSDYERRFAEPFPQKYVNNAARFSSAGLVGISDDSISFTVKGFLCSNTLTAEILYS